MGRIPILQTQDENGHPISKLMDQYEFCIRNIVDVSVSPEYILSAQPSGSFVIQKHYYIDGGAKEKMLYYKEASGRNPITVWAAELVEETLTYGEIWEVFGNVSFD
jgi:hypothetical protein